MMQGKARQYHRSDVLISPPDEFHLPLGGEGVLRVANAFAPRADTILQMLSELRRSLRWSQNFAAAVLGVTKSTVVKWEAGKRMPGGPAAKMIFFLHSQLIEGKKSVLNTWDLAVWGKIPCRNSVSEAIEIEATLYLSESEWRAVLDGQISDVPSEAGDRSPTEN